MKVLTRYLLRAHIGPLIFAFIALTGVILINTVAKALADLAGKGLPFDVVVEFFLLSLPANIALTLPMAVLVAVLYTFSSLAAEHEITALRASGIDLRRAALPLIVLAGIIAGGMVWFNDRVLPASNYRWRVLMTDVAQARPLLLIRPQTINPSRLADGTTPYYLEAQEVDPATGSMQGVSIFDVSDSRITRTIKADSGRMAFNEHYTDLLLTLYDGDMWEVDFGEPESFQVVGFRQQMMRMEGVSDRLQRTVDSGYRTDRDMTVGMMQERIDSLRVERRQLTGLPAAAAPPAEVAPLDPTEVPATSYYADSGIDEAVMTQEVYPGDPLPIYDQTVVEEPRDLSTGLTSSGAAATLENRRYVEARIRNIEYQIREFQVEIQKKYSIAAATLVFVLIGIPIALRFPRGGIGMVIAVSLGIFGIYYVGLIGGETLGDQGYVPPALAMWLTNGVFGIIGLIGFLKLGREQGTGRGGGWSDAAWIVWLREFFGRRRRSTS